MRLLALFIVLAALLDQISKYVVIHAMNLAQIRAIDVLPPLLNFRYGENRGINFGLFGDGTSAWVLIALALVICAAVLWWLRGGGQPRIVYACAGLLIGGALGNVIDRVLYGYVLDFLNISCCGIQNPFVFNVADIFIFAGAIGLVLFAKDQKPPSTKRGKKRA